MFCRAIFQGIKQCFDSKDNLTQSEYVLLFWYEIIFSEPWLRQAKEMFGYIAYIIRTTSETISNNVTKIKANHV